MNVLLRRPSILASSALAGHDVAMAEQGARAPRSASTKDVAAFTASAGLQPGRYCAFYSYDEHRRPSQPDVHLLGQARRRRRLLTALLSRDARRAPTGCDGEALPRVTTLDECSEIAALRPANATAAEDGETGRCLQPPGRVARLTICSMERSRPFNSSIFCRHRRLRQFDQRNGDMVGKRAHTSQGDDALRPPPAPPSPPPPKCVATVSRQRYRCGQHASRGFVNRRERHSPRVGQFVLQPALEFRIIRIGEMDDLPSGMRPTLVIGSGSASAALTRAVRSTRGALPA